MLRPLALGFALAATLPLANGADLLALVSQATDSIHSELKAFTCDERIERFKAKFGTKTARQLDLVTAQVSYSNGNEDYSNVLKNRKPIAGLNVLPGAWSMGEYGTLLKQTKTLIAESTPLFRQMTKIDQTDAAIYSFDTNESVSPWTLSQNGKDYKISFRTYIWVALNTGEIKKIARVSKDMASQTGISEMTWMVTLNSFEVGGKKYLVPEKGQYAITYQPGGWYEWNVITFSNYHRFEAETKLSYN